jgi:hypothetical protein
MKLRFLVLGATIFAFIGLNQAYAADCDFTKPTHELQNLKGEASSTLKELTLRQNLLYGILDCLTSSTEAMKLNYDSLPYLQNGLNLKTRFLDQLSGNLFYYGEKRKVIDGADIARTKLLAKELLDWKKSHENDLSRASYFLLWLKNQDFLNLAQDRATQIDGLKLSSKNRDNLTQAKGLLAAAGSLNSSAQESLERNSPPKESLALVKQSLQKMLDSYKYFIKISDSQ